MLFVIMLVLNTNVFVKKASTRIQQMEHAENVSFLYRLPSFLLQLVRCLMSHHYNLLSFSLCVMSYRLFEYPTSYYIVRHMYQTLKCKRI